MRLLLFFLILITVSSCKQATYCGSNKPIKDIGWIKNFLNANTANKVRIYSVTYLSQEGFLTEVCTNQDCNAFYGQFKDCAGTAICNTGLSGSAGQCLDFYSGVSHLELIYSN